MDNDGFISNGELFQVLKMMVGNNLKDTQLQQIVDKTIFMYDKVGCEIGSSIRIGLGGMESTTLTNSAQTKH